MTTSRHAMQLCSQQTQLNSQNERTDRQTDMQTDRQTDRRTDRQTNRQADRQTGRRTGRHDGGGDDDEDDDGDGDDGDDCDETLPAKAFLQPSGQRALVVVVARVSPSFVTTARTRLHSWPLVEHGQPALRPTLPRCVGAHGKDRK